MSSEKSSSSSGSSSGSYDRAFVEALARPKLQVAKKSASVICPGRNVKVQDSVAQNRLEATISTDRAESSTDELSSQAGKVIDVLQEEDAGKICFFCDM